MSFELVAELCFAGESGDRSPIVMRHWLLRAGITVAASIVREHYVSRANSQKNCQLSSLRAERGSGLKGSAASASAKD
jgi:hypothetical protein